MSVKKFLLPALSLLNVNAESHRAILSNILPEVLRSPSFKNPLVVPNAKILSEVGCILEHVTNSFTSYILSPRFKSTTIYGWSGFYRDQRKSWTSSEESKYSSLRELVTELINEQWWEGNTFLNISLIYCTFAFKDDWTVCILGIASYLPADFINFFYDFS